MNESSHRFHELYVFVADDEHGEGVCAAPIAGQIIPLIAADSDRLASLMPWARKVANARGKPVKLIKLTTRTEILEITPG